MLQLEMIKTELFNMYVKIAGIGARIAQSLACGSVRPKVTIRIGETSLNSAMTN